MNPLGIGRPRFITLDEAMAWQEIAIRQYGGGNGLRDRGLLESALAMPRQSFSGEYVHAYPFEMAAAYAFHLAQNHPFVDGNKRIALMCAGAFLRMNGWNLETEGTESADAVLALVAGSIDKAGFAQWLMERSRPRPVLELRDFFSVVAPHDVMRVVAAVIASGSNAEADATLKEAEHHIPMVSTFREMAKYAKESNQESQYACFNGMSVLLTSLYRIAEDMGYEW